MFDHIRKALAQIFDPRFRKVLLISSGITLAALIAFLIGMRFAVSYIPDLSFTLPVVGWKIGIGETLRDIAFSGAIFASMFLMFPVAALVIGLFLEEIADAVEARHYPGLPAPRKQGFGEVLKTSALFMLTLIGVNLLALPVYLISTIFAPFVFWLVNGFLLGREYFEVVALRRMEPATAEQLRKTNLMRIWFAGALMALPLSIPVVNLFVPLIGVAVFTHLFHKISGS